ncbi:unnamed protein product [Arabidopsis halleri]
MEMIDLALKDTLSHTKNGEILQGDLSDALPALLLLNHLYCYKNWVVIKNNKRAKGVLCIGGVMTPIIIACEVPIQTDKVEPRVMDIDHLRHYEYLEHNMVWDMHLYMFEHPSNKKANILLPCIAATRLLDGDNIDCEPATEDLYIEGAQPMEMNDSEEEGADEEMAEETEEEEYDTRMYHFGEHVAPARQSKSLTEPHKNISILQSWNKKQDKLLSKCWKTIKSLKSMLSCTSSNTAVPRGEAPEEMPSRRYEVPKPRQSMHEPSEQNASQVSARHSSHEPQEQKRKRTARLVRSSSKAQLLHARRSLDRSAGTTVSVWLGSFFSGRYGSVQFLSISDFKILPNLTKIFVVEFCFWIFGHLV